VFGTFLDFDTSHVKVNLAPAPICCHNLIVSIHLMLKLIEKSGGAVTDYAKFQYIPC